MNSLRNYLLDVRGSVVQLRLASGIVLDGIVTATTDSHFSMRTIDCEGRWDSLAVGLLEEIDEVRCDTGLCIVPPVPMPELGQSVADPLEVLRMASREVNVVCLSFDSEVTRYGHVRQLDQYVVWREVSVVGVERGMNCTKGSMIVLFEVDGAVERAIQVALGRSSKLQ